MQYQQRLSIALALKWSRRIWTMIFFYFGGYGATCQPYAEISFTGGYIVILLRLDEVLVKFML